MLPVGFWDSTALRQETIRQFDICGSCRMCLNFCPSFPAMFDAIDGHDGEAKDVSVAEARQVTELCYLCELCYLKCPYTFPHEWDIDIPGLLRRSKAVNAKTHGIPLRDRLIGDVERVNVLGSFAAPVINVLNRLSPTRLLLEKFIGLDRRAILPSFHWQTFARWFRKRASVRISKRRPRHNGKVAFFHTCLVNHNRPDIGIAAVKVLEHNGVEVTLPTQSDCGMPYIDMGALEHALGLMEKNIASLVEWVRDGSVIVVPEPTCGMMLKKEYPKLLGTDDARLVSENTYDISEYLLMLHKQGDLIEDFHWSPGTIAYHMPCHLRYQQMGSLTPRLLELIPGTTVEAIDRGCSGHDGTWGMKTRNYDLGMKVGRRMFEAINEGQSDVVVTDCSLAALQITQATGQEVLHPIEIVYRAYGID